MLAGWPGRAEPPPAAHDAAGPVRYVPGERVQVWSNGRKAWLNATVEAVFTQNTVAHGYSIAAGTVKVSSEAGVKWVMPENTASLLRKVANGAVAAGYPAPADRGLAAPSGAQPSAAPSAPRTTQPPPPPPPPPAPLRRSSTSVCSASSTVQLCKNGCGRVVQPGLTRGLKPYDTCCKRCAQKPGSDEHDENCGGRRLASKKSTECFDLGSSLKALLENMLRDQRRLQVHVNGVFTKVAGGGDRLNKAQVSQGLQALVEPFGIKLDIVEQYLSDICSKYGDSSGQVTVDAFLTMCRAVLQDRYKLWFPEVLPVKTTTFVKQNERPVEEVYMMGAKLGEGSFGTVYRVEHRISGERRVCKKIAKRKSDMTSDQILQEIGNMAMLDHPNVIKVYEYFDDGEYVMQIMEPCNGGELQEKVDVFRKTGRMPYDEAFMCDVMKQTLRALAFMHTMPFLHKDLKPQNIMMVEKDRSSIKVIDFGLAELFNKEQKYAAFVGGTLLYMAPEVFRQKMTVKVDVWSAGVILYNMCTGDFPFIAQWPPPPGRDEAWWQDATIKKISNEEMKDHPRLKNVSPLCRDLLGQMLQKDDSKRPFAAQCLDHPWFGKSDEVPPTLSVGVVQCVEAYARMSELKKAVFLLIAHQCEVQALFELRALFTHFDTRNRGSLSTVDLRQVLASSGMGPLTAERVIHALDRNADQHVSWTEFMAAAICVSVCRNQRAVDAAFATFDTDQDNKITADDIENVLAEVDSKESWHKRLPELFDEVVKTETGQPARPMKDAWKSIARAFKTTTSVRANKDQFRQYIGQKLDFRAGDALYAVT